MYAAEWSLELPVIVEGETVAWCPDVVCIMCLDENGKLWKVQFWAGDKLKSVHCGVYFDVALEVMQRDGDRIRQDAGYVQPYEAPEYSDREYVPVTHNLRVA